MTGTDPYPFKILDAERELIDSAGNVETVVSVLYGDMTQHPGTARIVLVPRGGSNMDEAASRIEYHADINADCWGVPLDRVERVNA